MKAAIEFKSKDGKIYLYSFEITRKDFKFLQEKAPDNIKIHEVRYVMPSWIVSLKLTKIYCFLYDIFLFRNPFNK